MGLLLEARKLKLNCIYTRPRIGPRSSSPSLVGYNDQSFICAILVDTNLCVLHKLIQFYYLLYFYIILKHKKNINYYSCDRIFNIYTLLFSKEKPKYVYYLLFINF